MPSTPHSQPASAWYVGLIYSLITVLSWATLPLALALVLKHLDAWTVTWFRMSVAALLLGGWVLTRGGKKARWQWPSRLWPGLLLAGLMLSGNYIFYVIGLDYTTPANAQVLIQLAPLFLALGGMAFFGERYNRRQWLGFAVLITGLIMFFRDQLAALGGQQQYLSGVIFILLAAVAWAAYALVQKLLMRDLRPMQIMLFIYCFATLLILPLTDLSALRQIDSSTWLWLIFCGLNTLIAYAAFGEAMHHWQASRVSAVIALVPLATIGLIVLLGEFLPGMAPPEKLNTLSISAALMVVAGSMLTSLAGRRPRIATPVKPTL